MTNDGGVDEQDPPNAEDEAAMSEDSEEDSSYDEQDLLPDPKDDAHHVALEYLKHVITLAAGVLALSATFVEKATLFNKWGLVVLGFGWLALAGAVFFGLEAISAIVKSRLRPEYKWHAGYGRQAFAVSKYSFVAGLLLIAIFAILVLAIRHESTTSRVDIHVEEGK